MTSGDSSERDREAIVSGDAADQLHADSVMTVYGQAPVFTVLSESAVRAGIQRGQEGRDEGG